MKQKCLILSCCRDMSAHRCRCTHMHTHTHTLKENQMCSLTEELAKNDVRNKTAEVNFDKVGVIPL